MSDVQNNIDFLTEPSRQSPVAILLILSRFFRVFVKQLWFVLVIFIFNPKRLEESWWIVLIVAVAFFSSLFSIISYFKFYFYIKDKELILEKGIFRKTKLNIPLERIQTVNFNQNVIHQIFNVVGVEIDTAGSKGNEFAISALTKERAEQIRTFLISEKSKTIEFVEEEGRQEVSNDEKVLLQLETKDLLKIGVGQNHLRMIGIIVAFLYGLFELAGDALGEKKVNETLMNQLDGLGFDTFFYVAVVFVPVFFVLAFFLTLINTVLRYHELQFIKTSRGFKVVAGLFNRQERSANMDKIQLIHWGVNPIKYLFKQYYLRLSQASSSSLVREDSIFIPGAYAPQLSAVQSAYFPELPQQQFTTHGISSVVILRRWFFFGVLPALPFLVFDLMWAETVNFYALAWVAIMFWAARRYHQKWKYSVSEDGLEVQRGVIGTDYALLKWYKVQAVEIRQTPYQRRKKLANIIFFTAAGSIQIPYIELKKAASLCNFVLYKVETCNQRWM